MNLKANVKRILFSECDNWILGSEIYHESGRYFSIIGLRQGNNEKILIRQEEVGILAILYCTKRNENYFLIQLKQEPGNIPLTQWAPTVQATKSNFERVHKGKPTPYLKYFLKQTPKDVIASEQGNKFYNKFNRNAIKEIKQQYDPVSNLFRWINTIELKESLGKNFCVNTDLRSVIATSDWTLYALSKDAIFLNRKNPVAISKPLNKSYHLIRPEIIANAIAHLKGYYAKSENDWEIIPLEQLKKYSHQVDGIYDNSQNPLVAYFDVELETREVTKWQQPLLCSNRIENCALCFKIENKIAYFFLQTYPEIGYIDRVEYGPSLQTGTGGNKVSIKEYRRWMKKGKSIASILQTDEGGRFFQIRHQYEIVWLDLANTKDLSKETGIWISVGELEILCKQTGVVTNELRTCVSILLSFA